MISAQSLVQGGARNAFYLGRSSREGPLQYQLWGRDPTALAEGARHCASAGADAIDLNCGCPARKVVAGGGGVALMREPQRVGRCVAALRQAVELPLSIKIRVGPDRQHFNALEVARIAEAEGIDFLTMHGRHGREAYSTRVRTEPIAEVVAGLAVPVIANGDVRDGATADHLVRASGCAGVMVGRACLGDPWVFQRIRTELGGRLWTPPSFAERGEVLLRNYRGLVALMGEDRATRHVRKLAAFYSRGVVGARDFRLGLNRCQNREDFTALVGCHFLAACRTGNSP